MAPNAALKTSEDSEKSVLLFSNEEIRKKKSKARDAFIQVIIISIVYMLGYSPFITLMNLEVILNAEIGSFVMLCVFCGTLVSFGTAPIITRLIGAKGSVLFGWIVHAIFAAVHFSPVAEVLLPVGIFVGIGHAQAWVTQGVYVATLALEYASATGQPQESVMGLFSGIFFTINTFNGVWGNLVSSLVLIKPQDAMGNSSDLTENLTGLCGLEFCPWEDTSGTYIREPDELSVTIVLCAFIGLDLLAFFIALFFLKNVHPETGDSLHSAVDFCGTILKMCYEKNLAFLLLPFMWIGFEIQFMMTEFTTAFVSCEIGIEYNGWSMICFAGGTILGSAITGRTLRYVGWPVMFAIATACNLACLAAMVFFAPSEQTIEFYLLIPVAWGLADSVWFCQMSAYIGHYFPQQKWPVYVTMRNFINVMYVILFGYTSFVCMDAKVYITISMVLLSLASFYTFEGLRKRKDAKELLKNGPTYLRIGKQ